MNQPLIDPKELTGKDKLYLFLLRSFSRLPLGFVQRLGAFIGLIVGRMHNATPYRVVKRNFELCFPEKSPEEIEALTRTNLIDTAPVAFEFAKTWGNSVDYSLGQIAQVHNQEVFDEAVSSGKGTIAIVPHFGTWEFMNPWTNTHTTTTIMYKPGKDKGVDAFVLEARGRLNANMVTADESGVRGMLKALKNGHFCGILPDHVPQDGGGIYAPFFGISTYTAVLVPRLVGRTGCNVVVMYCIRRPNGQGFDMYFERPDPEIFSQDLLTSTTAMNRTIESLIRRYPTHYHWFYKRFRKSENMSDPYRKQGPA